MGDVFKKTEIKKLLEDFDSVEQLLKSNSSEVQRELASYLYGYFEASCKETDLLNWAVQKEVATNTQPSSLCREDTFLSELLYVILFGDLGRKYLTLTINPLLGKILNLRSLKETPSDDLIITEQEIKAILSYIDEFIEILEVNIDVCPVSLREGFLTLLKVSTAKFKSEMSVQVMGSVIFLRFYCPPIIFPVKYSLLPEEEFPSKSLRMQKALVFTSKIVQCLANGQQFEPTKSHSASIDEFVESRTPKMKNFIIKLLDEKEISRCRKIVEASVRNPFNEVIQNQAADDLDRFLSRNAESNPIFKQERVLDEVKLAYSSEEGWKVLLEKKGCVYSRKKIEGCSYPMIRVQTTIRAPMRPIFESFLSLENEKCFPNLKLRIIEAAENRVDHHFQSKYPFPLTDRDYVMTRHLLWGEQQCWIYGYSVVRSDCPPTKNVIRAEIPLLAYILDKVDENTTNLTYLSLVDFKGNFPVWILNSSGEWMVNTFLKFGKHFQNLENNK